jgi:hypothetical protein
LHTASDVLLNPNSPSRHGWFNIEPCPSTTTPPISTQTVPELESLPSPLPPYIILKDSYSLQSHPTEQQVFHSVKGQFGVPDIVCSYIVKEGRDEIVPDDATYWALHNVAATMDSVEPTPERRSHIRTICLTRGRPLMTAEGPRELLRGVLHGILGISPSYPSARF